MRVPASNHLSAAALHQIADHLESIAQTYRAQARRAEENERAIEEGRQIVDRAIASPRPRRQGAGRAGAALGPSRPTPLAPPGVPVDR
jgi:hypothetical protein